MEVLCHQVILLYRSKESDFYFLAATLTSDNILDFNGYNMRDFNGYNMREGQMTGKSTKSETNIFYQPLIDKPPSDPSTVLTAILILNK